ncbi:MAG: hypothetical protein M3Y58_24345 [Chloroflexota bacterium]|nr:hypothetical protein [Chloroflexota bacterium]
MSGAEYEALLRRRRLWGVPPDVVEHLAAECQREQKALHARVKELEGRLARATVERDEASQTVSVLQERVARLEQENQEIANRPETIREEAVRFVVDAWTEAQTLREQTRQEIEATETKAREEVAAIRRDSMAERQRYEAEMADERARYEAEMADERQRFEAEIGALRERRQKAVVELESLAESLLSQATRGIIPPMPPTAPIPDDASPIAAAPSVPADESHDEPHLSSMTVGTPPIANGSVAEDQLLAKALNDLEAILNTSRKPNGA